MRAQDRRSAMGLVDGAVAKSHRSKLEDGGTSGTSFFSANPELHGYLFHTSAA